MTHQELAKRFTAILNNYGLLAEFKKNLGDELTDDYDIYLAMTNPADFMGDAFYWTRTKNGNPFSWVEIDVEWREYLDLIKLLQSSTPLTNTTTTQEA